MQSPRPFFHSRILCRRARFSYCLGKAQHTLQNVQCTWIRALNILQDDMYICILCSRVENRGGMTKQSKTRRICNERNGRVSTFVHFRETGEHPLSSTSEKRTNVPPRLWSVRRFVALWIHLKGDGPRSDFNKPGNSNRRVSLTQNGFLKRPNYNIAEQWWDHQCNPCRTGIAHFHFTSSTSGLLQWLQSSTPLMHRCGLAKERWPDTCIILPWD